MNDSRKAASASHRSPSQSKRKKRAQGAARPAYETPSAVRPPVSSPPPGREGVAARAPERPAGLDEALVTRLWLIGGVGTVGGALVAGFTFGVPSAVLVLVGGAFAAVIALFWGSLRTALGETPLASADAFALGASRTEDEQKRAVLRALKDVEFERSVGKISDEDYRALVAQYRAQAKQLLRTIDERSAENRKRAEEIVERRGIALSAHADEPTEPAETEERDDEA